MAFGTTGPVPQAPGGRKTGPGDPRRGYRFRCLTLYGVIDGMHRTIAHREAGKRIKAKIEGYRSIEPQSYLLWRDRLWRVSDGSGDGFIRDQKCCEILHALGVATGEQSANKNCPTFLRWDNLGQKRK